ncbi:MAG: hypothetical protein GF384_07285 [Elusimicrobia bacterium]|nr:hypothetical protein [Elusimicrobiota bacterium]MBD3412471.1 hypothetical protein [Elusimicrobiota bacterium]
MKSFVVEVFRKKSFMDFAGARVAKQAQELGFSDIQRVRAASVYRIDGNLSRKDCSVIAKTLLADPVADDFIIMDSSSSRKRNSCRTIEIWFHPNVTDTVGETVMIGVRDLGIARVQRVATGRSYHIEQPVSDDIVHSFTRQVLANSLIHTCNYY